MSRAVSCWSQLLLPRRSLEYTRRKDVSRGDKQVKNLRGGFSPHTKLYHGGALDAVLMPAASAFSTVFSGGQRFEEARLASSLATRSGARHSAGAKPKPGDTAFEAQAWHLPGTPAFYIYEDLLAWWKRACPVWVTAVSNVSVLASIHAERRKSVGGGDYAQHAAEILFPERLLAHPRRTRDPSTARLFVVPAFLGLSSRGQCGNASANVDELGRFLRGSSWFRRSLG